MKRLFSRQIRFLIPIFLLLPFGVLAVEKVSVTSKTPITMTVKKQQSLVVQGTTVQNARSASILSARNKAVKGFTTRLSCKAPARKGAKGSCDVKLTITGSVPLGKYTLNLLDGKRQVLAAGQFDVKVDPAVARAAAVKKQQAVAKKKADEIKNADALVALEGVGGSGVTADESSVKRYTEMVMKIRSEVGQDVVKATLEEMQKEMASLPVLSEVNTFDASVAGEAKVNAVMAMLIALVAIVAYIWIRFQQIAFGLAAVVALVHDVLVVLGLVAIASVLSSTPVGPLFMLTDFKINLSMIAAFLTIIGYSLNDTIVVFDRIREVRGKNPDIKPEMVNTSLNQTLSRTLLTSITTMLVVIVLYIIGGEGLHGFAFCLVAGVAVGTYSSIYVASPVLLKLAKRTT